MIGSLIIPDVGFATLAFATDACPTLSMNSFAKITIMPNIHTETTPAASLRPEQARTLFDHLLPAIFNSRALTRELIRNVADSKLGFQTVAGGETLSDLMWYLASAYDVFLNALCDAKFPDLPAKPQPATVQAFLDWDDNRFEQTVERAKALSNEDLLRPLTFGPFTQPAVEFMTAFLSNVASHTGQLMMGLALTLEPHEQAAQQAGAVQSVDAQSDSGELSDQQLVEVAGGGYPGPGMNTINFTFNDTRPLIPPQDPQVQTGLGSLFGNGENNLTGFAAVIPGLALGVGAAAWAQWVMLGTLAFMRF